MVAGFNAAMVTGFFAAMVAVFVAVFLVPSSLQIINIAMIRLLMLR